VRRVEREVVAGLGLVVCTADPTPPQHTHNTRTVYMYVWASTQQPTTGDYPGWREKGGALTQQPHWWWEMRKVG
jgi:hypothetical protein